MGMMQRQTRLTHKLGAVFEQRQADMLAEVITDAYTDLATTSDFSELKAIVNDLAEAQRRTEQRMEELAEAQKETQVEVRKLAQGLRETNSHLGGLGRSVAYALENEAYRNLPAVLRQKYGIEMTEKMVRTTIDDEEINILGRGRQDGRDVLIVGETKLRLDERRRKKRGRREIFEQLEGKVKAAAAAYPGVDIIPLLVTHFARPGALEDAEEQGIIVVQSFEW
jgi:hypothetical protein